MKIQGASGGAKAPTDVLLEDRAGEVGPTLGIHLSQTAKSTAVWVLAVDVHIDQGWYRLGSFTTNTVLTDGVAARCVGFAFCPGAMGWRVQAICVTEGETADLVLKSTKCCGGAFGVTKNVVAPPT